MTINRNLPALLTLQRELPQLGFHTSANGPAVNVVRGVMKSDVIGYSCHSVTEARDALNDRCTYISYSPVFPTTSKPGASGKGVLALASVCQAVGPMPVMALGGIGVSSVAACLRSGAYGVAILSGIMEASNVPKTVHRYLESIQNYEHP